MYPAKGTGGVGGRSCPQRRKQPAARAHTGGNGKDHTHCARCPPTEQAACCVRSARMSASPGPSPSNDDAVAGTRQPQHASCQEAEAAAAAARPRTRGGAHSHERRAKPKRKHTGQVHHARRVFNECTPWYSSTKKPEVGGAAVPVGQPAVVAGGVRGTRAVDDDDDARMQGVRQHGSLDQRPRWRGALLF